MQVVFEVPGEPKGKGRPRFSRGHVYTPARTTEYESWVRLCWKTQSGKRLPDGEPIKATVNAYFKIPKSASKKRSALLNGAPHTSKCDIDNLLKAIFDALTDYAYKDDAAIFQVIATKVYSTSPRVEVALETKEVNAGG